jgi:hypothetical protein
MYKGKGGSIVPKRALIAVVAMIVTASVVSAGALAGQVQTAGSTSYLLKATMDTRQQVPVPKDATAAKGVFTAKLVVAGKKSSLVWQLRFSGLSGRAVAAHVDVGAPRKAGVVAMPLCTKCVADAHGAYTGSYVASRAFLKAILHSGMYATITTRLNPKGEIRGQIKATAAG